MCWVCDWRRELCGVDASTTWKIGFIENRIMGNIGSLELNANIENIRSYAQKFFFGSHMFSIFRIMQALDIHASSHPIMDSKAHIIIHLIVDTILHFICSRKFWK